ncbi:hypothetical protein [Microbulbifer epialgicus]|uniref:Uncharacterized protein n=1 Tax=Microbulbifer epialgicus TaxID=393907 RepID=A0ABV4NTE0_9GAMM
MNKIVNLRPVDPSLSSVEVELDALEKELEKISGELERIFGVSTYEEEHSIKYVRRALNNALVRSYRAKQISRGLRVTRT